MKGHWSFQGFHPVSALVLHLQRAQCDLRDNKAILLGLEQWETSGKHPGIIIIKRTPNMEA